MKKQKPVRIATVAGLIVLALGTIVLAAGGLDTRSHSTVIVSPGTTTDGAPDDVMASVDQALGRTSTMAQSSTNIAPVAPFASSESKSLPAASGGVAAVPPVAQTAPGGTTSPAPALNTNDRKIVQTASLKLQVKDVGASFEDVGRIATGAGGFVASSNFSFAGEQQIASVSIRVPADRYQDVLGQLRGVGAKMDAETSNASDVTDEYTDLGARQRNLEATQAQLLTLLGQAKNINEVLQVQDRLNTVQGQLEQAKGRIALLDRLGNLATISISLRPVVAAVQAPHHTTGLETRVDEAWQNSLDFLGDVLGGVLSVVIFVWWLPLVALPTYALGARLLRNRPAPVSAVD